MEQSYLGLYCLLERLLKHFSRRQKQTTFAVTGVLRVKAFQQKVTTQIILKHELSILYDCLVTVKTAPHECVIRTGQPQAEVKAEIEAWFYPKVTVSSCAITSV